MRTVIGTVAMEDGTIQLVDEEKTPKASEKASVEADRVSKETVWVSEETRSGGGGRKREIEGEGEEEELPPPMATGERFLGLFEERKESDFQETLTNK